MASYFKVNTQGQSLVVNITSPDGTAAVVYTDDTVTSTRTLPLAITADTEFWFAQPGRLPFDLTVTNGNGQILHSATHFNSPDAPVIVSPEPSEAQLVLGVSSGDGARPTGAIAETVPRVLCAVNGSVLASGDVTLVGVHLQKGALVRNITFVSATTALDTGTVQVFGLYDVDLALLGVTADDEDTAWAANSEKTLALTAEVEAAYSGLHYIGVLVAADTPPTLLSFTSSTVATGIVPVLVGTSDESAEALADPAAALTATATVPYAYLS
jgi:hypothetical protein